MLRAERTSVTMSGELLEAAGLVGGSKACVPRQPFVQPAIAARSRANLRRVALDRTDLPRSSDS